jgi:hypothetical protein
LWHGCGTDAHWRTLPFHFRRHTRPLTPTMRITPREIGDQPQNLFDLGPGAFARDPKWVVRWKRHLTKRQLMHLWPLTVRLRLNGASDC